MEVEVEDSVVHDTSQLAPKTDTGIPSCPNSVDVKVENQPPKVQFVPKIVKVAEPSIDEIEHKDNCRYYRWKVPHRASIFTIEEAEQMFEENMRKVWRKRKGYNETVHGKQIRLEVQEKLKSGPVRDYIEGCRIMYDSYEELMKKECRCPRKIQTNVPLRDAKTTLDRSFASTDVPLAEKHQRNVGGVTKFTVDNVEDIIRSTGLELSESEDDD